MIDISERAQAHFLRLLSTQGSDGLGIRLRVVAAGTPAAQCELEFCEAGELTGNEWTVECKGFNLYVDGDSVRWLDPADIDYETNATGGQLNIRAPRIKGEEPGEGSSLVERVRYVLEAEIAPRVASHGGRISLIEVDADGVVILQFGGGCHGCGMVDVTLKNGVEKTLRERIPEITEVRDATDHKSGKTPFYAGASGASALT
ncbi:Fe/S biogenesis protein NfuA [Luteibacter sp. Sphag1AF]|uniref:NfuA family Fe-S biogenesis protein n=1 Tax=Luteibacter sp. Sphag1AF TaxID=2587031 RepID=UPI00160E75E9|nr:NfuA family Fe-S biogenesis protein [Luteibacter sp. Sphag1AF]MBB3226967.1 Fe/S biogenesis protein NfuA [Luteibacter sp. Sphag1AF]